HTEYRYVLAVDYFLFAFVGVALSYGGSFVIKKIIPSPPGLTQSNVSTDLRSLSLWRRLIKPFPRFTCFRAVWIFSDDLTPRPALVMELFRSAIEGEGYALPVVAIEA